jgi:hypothetical protein
MPETKICRKNPNTHFMFKYFSENRAVCEIMWKDAVQPDMPKMKKYGACALHAA